MHVKRIFKKYIVLKMQDYSIQCSFFTTMTLKKANKLIKYIVSVQNKHCTSQVGTFLVKYQLTRITVFISLLYSDKDDPPVPPPQDRNHPAPSVTEMSELIIFLLDVLPLVNCSHTHTPLVLSLVKPT